MPIRGLNIGRARRPSLAIAVLSLTLIGLSCQTAPRETAPPPSVSSETVEEPAECPTLDLLAPSGGRVDLSGIWTSGTAQAGDEITYELRQSGECVWGRGFSSYRGQEPGESFDMVLVGTVHSDFTAELDLLELHVGDFLFYQPFGRASITLEIRFDGENTDEPTVLEIVALRARPLPGAGAAVDGRLFGVGGPSVGAVLTRSP